MSFCKNCKLDFRSVRSLITPSILLFILASIGQIIFWKGILEPSAFQKYMYFLVTKSSVSSWSTSSPPSFSSDKLSPRCVGSDFYLCFCAVCSSSPLAFAELLKRFNVTNCWVTLLSFKNTTLKTRTEKATQ